jgi:hypothetical protein
MEEADLCLLTDLRYVTSTNPFAVLAVDTSPPPEPSQGATKEWLATAMELADAQDALAEQQVIAMSLLEPLQPASSPPRADDPGPSHRHV